MTKTTFTHTIGAETFTRKSTSRVYTHVVERTNSDGQTDVLSWHGSQKSAQAAASSASKSFAATELGYLFTAAPLS